MKLIIFLGNKGEKYTYTRHNAGFLCGDFLREEWNFPEWKEEKKFFGWISSHTMQGEKVFFLKPNTFMNLSGKAALSISNFYNITVADILIIYDDKDLPFETIRYREKGSSGGQNGMKDIIRVFNTPEIKRIKIGVGSEKQVLFKDPSDFVLSSFIESEKKALPSIFEETKSIITDFISQK